MTLPGTGQPTFDYGMLKTLAMLVFFALFAAIGVRLLVARAGKYDRAARLPLEDDPE